MYMYDVLTLSHTLPSLQMLLLATVFPVSAVESESDDLVRVSE